MECKGGLESWRKCANQQVLLENSELCAELPLQAHCLYPVRMSFYKDTAGFFSITKQDDTFIFLG